MEIRKFEGLIRVVLEIGGYIIIAGGLTAGVIVIKRWSLAHINGNLLAPASIFANVANYAFISITFICAGVMVTLAGSLPVVEDSADVQLSLFASDFFAYYELYPASMLDNFSDIDETDSPSEPPHFDGLDGIDIPLDNYDLADITFDPNDVYIINTIDETPSWIIDLATPLAPTAVITNTPISLTPDAPIDYVEACVVQVREDLSANVNIRDSYNTNSNVLTVVERGDLLADVSNAAAYDDGTVWYQITTLDGVIGWVHGDLITLDGCDTPRFITVPVEPQPTATIVPVEPQPTAIPPIIETDPKDEPTPNPTEPTIDPDGGRPMVEIRTPFNSQVIFSVSETGFEAVAYDPDYGTDNGANIAYVEFNIYDPQGNHIYQRIEHHVRYCAGRGDQGCELLPFLVEQTGVYTITAQAWDNDGQVSDIATHTFTIADTTPTPEPTTATPEPTIITPEPTPIATEPTAVVDPEPNATPAPDNGGVGNNDNSGDDDDD